MEMIVFFYLELGQYNYRFKKYIFLINKKVGEISRILIFDLYIYRERSILILVILVNRNNKVFYYWRSY